MAEAHSLRRLVLAFALAVTGFTCVCFGTVGATPARAVSYCGIYVNPYTDCANMAGGQWVNGYFNYNWAHAQNSLEGGTGKPVCEHTYIYGTGTTVSNHCESPSAYSFCDLYWYYKNGYELSGHAVNDMAFSELIWGHTNIVTENQCA